MSEKCFCHLNGYAVKDATARTSIATLKQELTEHKNAEVVDTTARANLTTHNTGTDTHNDIRLLIEGLTTRLNTLLDSDDTTLDQLSEIVAYIKNNKSLIEGVTTSKINVTDIIDNLTTNVENKPLSAKQGVILKGLIDDLTTSLTTANGYIADHETRITALESSGGGITFKEVTETELKALMTEENVGKMVKFAITNKVVNAPSGGFAVIGKLYGGGTGYGVYSGFSHGSNTFWVVGNFQAHAYTCGVTGYQYLLENDTITVTALGNMNVRYFIEE